MIQLIFSIVFQHLVCFDMTILEYFTIIEKTKNSVQYLLFKFFFKFSDSQKIHHFNLEKLFSTLIRVEKVHVHY